jgi:aspartate/methionine/tyrosine aminotransferase
VDIARSRPDVIRLEIGDPEFPTPPHIVAAAERAARSGFTHYAANVGVPELRQALAEKVRTRNGYDVRPEQVVVTQGATQGIFAALLATTEPGDGILAPDPAWPTYAMTARVLRLDCATYQLTEAAGFVPTVEQLEQLVTTRTRVLLVNSPSNPLGAVIGRNRMRDLMEFAARHDLWIVSDECYDEIVFDSTFVSAAAVDPDRVISAYSFSKTYAMTGWRIGYLVVPDRVTSVVAKCQEALIACVNTPTQWAALAALSGPQDCVAEMREAYERRRDRVLKTLESYGIAAFRPSGSFFVWLDVSGSGMSDHEFALRLLKEQGVAVVPGTAFGEAGAGYVRISAATADDDLIEGVERLAAWLTELCAGRARCCAAEARPATRRAMPGGMVECGP